MKILTFIRVILHKLGMFVFWVGVVLGVVCWWGGLFCLAPITVFVFDSHVLLKVVVVLVYWVPALFGLIWWLREEWKKL